MTTYQPWRYKMPECGSHAWTPRGTGYRCKICGGISPVLFDKKLDQLVDSPGNHGDQTPHHEVEP